MTDQLGNYLSIFSNIGSREGMSKVEALSRAQRKLAEEYSPPVAWAGFIMIGDGR